MSEKRKLAGAVAELHQCVHEIRSLYNNDVPGRNMDRADRIAAQVERADKIAKVLWQYPPEYPNTKPFLGFRP